MASVEGKNIIITGGTSGIGCASVLKLVENGANVVFCGRSEEKGNEVIQNIINEMNKVKFIQCNLTDKNNVKIFFEQAVDFLGRIDCAFNNAGIEGDIEMFAESTEENWDNVINTNLKSMWYCLKYEVEHMLNHGGGSIINMASTSGLVGNGFGLSAYAASKHAIVGLTKSIALEYAKQNIRANALCPGFVDTPMIDTICEKHPKMRRRFEAAQPLGRMGRPDEIANAVTYLCSDDSTFMTGHTFVIDGGLII